MTTPAVLAKLAARARDTKSAVADEPSRDGHEGQNSVVASGARRARRRGEYRSFFTFTNGGEALALILEQTATWLREKGFDVPLEESNRWSSGERSLTVVHRRSSQCHDVRLLLSEPSTPSGRWDTELTLHLPERKDGWLALHVSNDQGHVAAPPRLARFLLDVVEAHDASLRLTSSPTVVRSGGVEDLLGAVCDPDRYGLLFVVGTADIDEEGGRTFSAFQKRVNRWARDVVGLGQIVVLDPLATKAFNDGIGPTHGVEPWSIRTYAPDPDPAWTPDARRHRIFSAPRLQSSADPYVGRVLGSSARAHAADRRLPGSVSVADRDLRRAIDRLVLDGIFGVSGTSSLASPDTDVEDVEGVEGVEPEAAVAVERPTTTKEVEGGTLSERTIEAVADLAVSFPAEVARREEEASPVGGHATRPIHNPTLQVGPGGHTGLDTEHDAQLAALVDLLEEKLALVTAVLELDEVTAESLRTYRRQSDDAVATATARAAHASGMADLARARLEEQQASVEELEEDLQFHRDYATAADELRDEADLRARRAADEAQYLRKQLAAANEYDVAYGAVPSDVFSSHPDSFDDLLTRMVNELHEKGVVFTGDASITQRLDNQDSSGRLVRSTWECLIALLGYVEAKKAGVEVAGVRGYLTESPTGYPMVSRNKFAARESTSTMNKFGDERRFRVPDDVCPDGTVLMEAHFKLGTLGLVSPRMHFYDDTASSGVVYVGFIGPHLTTEQTN